MAIAAATPLLPSKPLPRTFLPVTPPEPFHQVLVKSFKTNKNKALTFTLPQSRGVSRHPPLVTHEATGRSGAEEAPALGAGVCVGHVHRRPRHLGLATQEATLHDLLTHVENIVHLVRLVTLVVMMATVIIVLLMASIASVMMMMLLTSCQTLDTTEESRARRPCGSQGTLLEVRVS